MVCVVFLASFAMGLGTMLITSLLHANAAARQHLNDAVTIDRLARQFRADVHEALRAETLSATAELAAVCRLELPHDVRVQYVATATGVRRQMSHATARPDDKPAPQGDDFDLPEGLRAEFAQGLDGEVRMNISPSGESAPATGAVALGVRARLGWNHRFAPPGKEPSP